MSDAWQRFLALFGENVAVQCLAILVVSLVAAWVVDRSASLVFHRWTHRTRTDLDGRILGALRGPIRTSVILAGLTLVTLRLQAARGEGTTEEVTGLDPAALTLKILASLAIIVWTVTGLRLADLLLNAASGRVRFVEARTLPLFSNLARVAIASAALYFAFLTWGIDVTAWLAAGGIAGIALGFAAKDTLANFFAGIFILTDAPYKVGDFIVLESGERGQVVHVGIRSTRLLTRDDVEITIPNSVMGNATIVNESSGRWTRERVRVKVGVAYGSDIDDVRRVLVETARAEELVCKDPEPRVRFRSFGESGLDLELLVWIDEPVLRGRALDALNTAIYKRFAAEGIEIPFPQRDLWIRRMPPSRFEGVSPEETAEDVPGEPEATGSRSPGEPQA